MHSIHSILYDVNNALEIRVKSYPKAGVLPVSIDGGFVGALAAIPVTVDVVAVVEAVVDVSVMVAVVEAELEGKHCE